MRSPGQPRFQVRDKAGLIVEGPYAFVERPPTAAASPFTLNPHPTVQARRIGLANHTETDRCVRQTWVEQARGHWGLSSFAFPQELPSHRTPSNSSSRQSTPNLLRTAMTIPTGSILKPIAAPIAPSISG